MNQRSWVPARVDTWLVAAVAVGLGMMVTAVVLVVAAPGGATSVKVLVGVLAAGTVALTVGLTIPLRYAFEDGGVFVRSGLLKVRVAYRDIVLAHKVVSPLSSAAWSMVKVRLVLAGGGLIEIAPRDREAFLDELARRAPHLVREERGLRDPTRS